MLEDRRFSQLMDNRRPDVCKTKRSADKPLQRQSVFVLCLFGVRWRKLEIPTLIRKLGGLLFELHYV